MSLEAPRPPNRRATPIRRAGGTAALAATGALLCLLSAPALAVQPDEILKDPVLEARARSISHGLRCLVCQNQSIDDSDAPLARDLRILVRERLQAGDSDQGVRDFIVARYGDFVLLKPPLKTDTLLLWLIPPLVLLAAVAATIAAFRRSRGSSTQSQALTAEEEARLSELLEGGPAAAGPADRRSRS